jgi:hypothetical protein
MGRFEEDFGPFCFRERMAGKQSRIRKRFLERNAEASRQKAASSRWAKRLQKMD